MVYLLSKSHYCTNGLKKYENSIYKYQVHYSNPNAFLHATLKDPLMAEYLYFLQKMPNSTYTFHK